MGWAGAATWRYPLQMAVGSWVAYSVLLDYWIAWIGGYPGMQVHSLGNFFKFFGANSPWLAGHLYLMADAARAVLPVLSAVRKKESRRDAPVRVVPSFETARTLRQRARAAGL